MSTLPAARFWMAPDGWALSMYDGTTLPNGPILFGLGGDSRLLSGPSNFMEKGTQTLDLEPA
jgi:hypothetical protein